MPILYKGITTFLIAVIVATVAVFTSSSYYSTIAEEDLKYSETVKSSITNFYENTKSNNQIREENDVNNIQQGSSSEGGSENIENIIVPDFTSGVEAYTFAENLLAKAKGIHIETKGKAATDVGIIQDVRNVKKRDVEGNVFYEAVAYSSLVKTAIRVNYNGYLLASSKTSSVSPGLIASYSGWDYNMSLTSFKKTYGLAPDELNYIVNAQTVVKESNFVYNQESKECSFALELNSDSAAKYKYMIQANAGSSGFPSFGKIILEVKIKDGKFQSIRYLESYQIQVSIYNSKINTDITDTFRVVGGNVTVDKI